MEKLPQFTIKEEKVDDISPEPDTNVKNETSPDSIEIKLEPIKTETYVPETDDGTLDQKLKFSEEFKKLEDDDEHMLDFSESSALLVGHKQQKEETAGSSKKEEEDHIGINQCENKSTEEQSSIESETDKPKYTETKNSDPSSTQNSTKRRSNDHSPQHLYKRLRAAKEEEAELRIEQLKQSIEHHKEMFALKMELANAKIEYMKAVREIFTAEREVLEAESDYFSD